MEVLLIIIYLTCAIWFGLLAASTASYDLRDSNGKVDLETSVIAVLVFFIAGALWWMILPFLILGYLLKLFLNRDKMK